MDGPDNGSVTLDDLILMASSGNENALRMLNDLLTTGQVPDGRRDAVEDAIRTGRE